MNKLTIHIVAKDEDFKISNDEILNFQQTNPDLKNKVFIKKHSNNALSLPDIYNSILQQERALPNELRSDMIAFMHADVNLDLKHFVNHLIEVEQKYDAIGLCGCSKISVSQKPLNWYCGSRPYPDHRWGCVIHGELGNQESFFNRHSPEVTDHQVACIDGLCIVIGKRIIDNNEFEFDPNYKFNHYDTDFSFQCVMKYNYKLGVIVERTLNHYSVGKGILSKEFLEEEEIFRKKWNI